jgi:tRNA threonylcarbamoyladenosine biosynthesis protein TsaB
MPVVAATCQRQWAIKLEEQLLKVLALDTSTPRGSVAMLDGKELVGELRLISLETHSARLLASVEFMLKIAGWKLDDLELIVAGIGPGSFTGIRIGLATAMGLAQVMAIPFAGISCLDALAHQIPIVEGRIGIVSDAQRAQVYFAEYFRKQGRTRRVGKPALLYPKDLARRLRRARMYLAGDGAMRYATELNPPKSNWPRLVTTELYLSSALGRLALERRRAWRTGEFLEAKPLYIRPPDAKRPRVNKR